MSQIKYFKIYGERNSGTNYLYNLIRKNFNLKYLGHHWDSPFQWKHDLINYEQFKEEDYLADKTMFLCIYKNPYSWALSMHYKPHHMSHLAKKNISMESFLNRGWNEEAKFASLHERRGTISINLQKYNHVFDLRYKKLDSHLNIKDHVKYFHSTGYEDLLKNPNGVLNVLADNFKLSKNPDFENVNYRCDPVNREDLPFDLYVGGRLDDGVRPAGFFDGIIDELAIYDRVLTPEEIGHHYQNG